MDKKKEEAVFDGRIWQTILQFNVDLDSQLTSKANFIFGASTIIFMFVLNKFSSLEFLSESVLTNLPWTILLIGSFASSILSMMVILPKLRIFSKKERFKEDVFYYKNINKFYSRKEYLNYLKDLPLDNKRISEAYANQIYSLSTNILPYKFKMLKISGWFLVIGLLLSIFFKLLITIFL